MTVRDIRLFGDPVLKTVSTEITEIDDGVRGLVADLIDSVELPGRAGVAAAQIGVNLRAFSYNIDGDVGYIINPVLVELSGEPELVDEGCLSVPGLSWEIIRPNEVHVTGVDLDGNVVSIEASEYAGRVFQHELDHLDGVLLIERLDDDQRRSAKRAVREMLMARSAGPQAGLSFD